MTDVIEAAEAFSAAAKLNREDALRQGSLLCFPNYGQLVMTGDLHGHRRNFEKLRRFCDLPNAGARHVILHEIIHEEIEALGAVDRSHELLLDAVRWKCDFPDQVHFLQSNHELAQLQGAEITKNGRVVTYDFDQGVREAYGTGADRVLGAIDGFIASLPLAGRTANRVFLSHSLPSPRQLPAFDPTIFSRTPTDEDFSERGSGYALVWGRYQTKATIDSLCEILDVDFFLCGHQPQDMGYEVFHDHQIILASEHDHGVFLPFDLAKPQTIERLVENIRPFVGVV